MMTFQSLLETISALSLEEKRKLWQFLEQEITQTGEKPVNHNLDDKPCGEILTIEEIRRRYPHEWVLIAEVESDEQWNVIRGEVLAHSPEREEIDKALIAFENVKSLAIEYTGPVPQDYAVLL